MIHFTLLHPRASHEMVGFLPQFFNEADPRSAAEQMHTSYAHGGGWTPFSGFTITPAGALKYPGDSLVHPIAEAKLRDETIRLYEYEWVAIIQKDGSFEVCRCD